MGKSPKPLSFLIHPSLMPLDAPGLTALAEQGHTFGIMGDAADFDLILGPNCWRAFDLKHLDLAIKSARAVKFPIKPKAEKKPHKPRKKKSDENI